IYYVAESPHEEGVIYTASDCGLVWLTRDGGATWNNVTPRGLPETMIHALEISPHDPGTVYFASTRYKLNDLDNYSYKSTDYGKSWTQIGQDVQADDFFRVIREDPVIPGLLYAGAERGFYISFNGGKDFQRLQLNLPVVPITDLVIRDNSLAAATAGRSFWILDDLSAIQQSRGKAPASATLYQPKAHHRLFGQPGFFLITEHAFGENPPEGVALDYYLASDDTMTMQIEILDMDGHVIRTIEGTREAISPGLQGGRGNLPGTHTEKASMQPGVNRFVWDFRTDGLIRIPETFVLNADYRGHRVAPGTYTARLKYGDVISEAQIVIHDPPDLEVPAELWTQQQQLMTAIEGRINEIHRLINATMDMRDRLEEVSALLADRNDLSELSEMTAALDQRLADWQSVVIELRQKGFQDALNWPAGMNSEYFMLRGNLDTYDPRIPAGYLERFADLNTQWVTHRAHLDDIIEREVAEFNAKFREHDLPVIPAIRRIDP
ncbi:MAG: glycosyl hydrolase, partial [Saprospiraceae bacterium]|nr:glycosyl hydrolase [Saprospiraceae bacterium]